MKITFCHHDDHVTLGLNSAAHVSQESHLMEWHFRNETVIHIHRSQSSYKQSTNHWHSHKPIIGIVI